MIVTGGAYLELCLRPEWRRLFGSGLRAACAVAPLSPSTVLHTYAFKDWAADIRHSAAAFGCNAIVREIEDAISFSYNHPLSPAIQTPYEPEKMPPLEVNGDVVLRFGFVEGDAIVRATRAVYDPQGARFSFRENGSSADNLALVLNEDEAKAAGFSDEDNYQGLLEFHGAHLAVIKRGPKGASIYSRDYEAAHIDAYRSQSVFKIGSGDVFSAAFALYWGERQMSPLAAAELASKSVAQFVDGHLLPLDESTLHGAHIAAKFDPTARIYLAGPFFDLAQRWVIEEAKRSFASFRVDVFSPLHEVGTGLSTTEIANADLAGLRSCTKVLAILNGMDPGTVFEVGYARACNIPVVALVERSEQEHLTMLEGSGCEIVTDFTSAIYRTLWI